MTRASRTNRFLPHDWFPRPLPGNVILGEESWLYSSFAFLHYRSRRPLGLRVGKHTGIYQGTFFEMGTRGEVSIGDYCTIVGAMIRSEGRVVIEDFVFIAHEVFLADSFAPVPPEGSIRNAGAPGGNRVSIFIGKNAWIGMRAVLLGGTRVGEGAVVGAAAVVDFEVPPFTVVAGNPARVVRELAP